MTVVCGCWQRLVLSFAGINQVTAFIPLFDRLSKTVAPRQLATTGSH